MKFIPILTFYLNHRQLELHHKQFVAVTKITRRKHHAQVHKKYPGKPFSIREENPANPLLYSSRERPPTP
jgi:hypothetical protein